MKTFHAARAGILAVALLSGCVVAPIPSAGPYYGEPVAAAQPVAQPVAPPVAAVPAKPAAPAAPAAVSQASTYEVKSGDTPWAISRKFNIPFNTLMKENGISDAQSLQIGQKLRIPAAR